MGFIILIITKLIGLICTGFLGRKIYQLSKAIKLNKKKAPDEDDTEPSKHDTLINNLPNNIVPVMYLYLAIALVWTLMATTSGGIWLFIVFDGIILFFLWALS